MPPTNGVHILLLMHDQIQGQSGRRLGILFIDRGLDITILRLDYV